MSRPRLLRLRTNAAVSDRVPHRGVAVPGRVAYSRSWIGQAGMSLGAGTEARARLKRLHMRHNILCHDLQLLHVIKSWVNHEMLRPGLNNRAELVNTLLPTAPNRDL